MPNIYPGVVCEEERVRTANQRAMYRRLFMDIEREQVKENLRRLEHKQKINWYIFVLSHMMHKGGTLGYQIEICYFV